MSTTAYGKGFTTTVSLPENQTVNAVYLTLNTAVKAMVAEAEWLGEHGLGCSVAVVTLPDQTITRVNGGAPEVRTVFAVAYMHREDGRCCSTGLAHLSVKACEHDSATFEHEGLVCSNCNETLPTVEVTCPGWVGLPCVDGRVTLAPTFLNPNGPNRTVDCTMCAGSGVTIAQA